MFREYCPRVERSFGITVWRPCHSRESIQWESFREHLGGAIAEYYALWVANFGSSSHAEDARELSNDGSYYSGPYFSTKFELSSTLDE